MDNKLKPYDEYKESKADYIGKYPSHWAITKLRFIFEERKEKNINQKQKNILSVMKNRGVIPYSEKGNVGNKHSEDIERYNLVYEDDIVMNSMNVIIGSVGRSKYNGALSPVYYVFKNRDTNYFNTKYFENLFKMKSLQRELTKYGKGILAHRMRIPMELLKNLELPLPPKEEQDKIVKYLDNKLSKINKFIKAKKRQIELLKEQKQAVINKAVTKGLDPNAKMKPSGVEWIGDIPEMWEVLPLKVLVDVTMGQSPSSESYNDEKKGIQFLQGNADFGKIYPNTNQYTIESKKICEKGDILLSVRAPVGAKNIADKNYCIGRGLCAITPLIIDLNFLWYFIEILNIEFKYKSKGSTYESVTVSDVRNSNVCFPKIDEQRQIVSHIESKTTKIDQTIDTIIKEITLITEYRTSLISNVVTGKVDVRDIDV